MNPRWETGLICAGGVSQSFLAGMPGILHQIGPVKSSSLRVSARLANRLRTGFAVPDYAALAQSHLVWISVSEQSLDRLCLDLAAEPAMRGKDVVICDTFRESTSFNALRRAGMRIVTLNPVPESGELILTAEGDKALLTTVRRMLAAEKRRVIAIEPGTKLLFWCGVYLCSRMLVPIANAAAGQFRRAGFSRRDAVSTLRKIAEQSLAAFDRAGERGGNRGWSHALDALVERQLRSIRFLDPRLAAALHVAQPHPPQTADSPHLVRREHSPYLARAARK